MSYTFAPPSQLTLDRAPQRVTTFISAVARHRVILATLTARGYTQDDHNRAVALLNDLTRLPEEKAPPAPLASRAAIAELDAWDEPNFATAFHTLNRRAPDQARFIFDGLSPAAGFDAVLAVQIFLDRLDALQSSPDREATRDADAAALDLLAARGITPQERARLRGLIQTATTLDATPPALEDDHEDQRQQARNATLLDLHLWWKEWSEVARHTLRRRQYLIWLGLANPRGSSNATDDDLDPT